jgi:hypothetical protein
VREHGVASGQKSFLARLLHERGDLVLHTKALEGQRVLVRASRPARRAISSSHAHALSVINARATWQSLCGARKKNIFHALHDRGDFLVQDCGVDFPKTSEAAKPQLRWQGEAKMSFNLFDWIRESVKRSVIQGFSEALEAIGADDDARLRLAQLSAASATPSLTPGSDVKRKRLGRSLREADGGP